jgi:dephospho-CoA kinase
MEVVEPELYRSWQRFQEKNYKSIYCIFHSSILFEREWNKSMDFNISVFAPYADRVDRCKFLTNKSVSSIYSLSKLEMDELDKNKLSEYVIHNYNDDSPFYGDALTQVNKIDKKIIDNYLKGKMSTKEFAL